MKKNVLLSMLLFASISTFAQVVPTKKMAFIAKKTATWCNPCGTWGWTAFSDIYNTSTGEPFIAAEMHMSTSSVLHSSDAAGMYNYMDAKGSTPVFYVNSKNETQYSTGGGIFPSTTKTRVLFVADSIGQTNADINSAYTASIDQSGIISVTTKTKAFNTVTGEYYLGVYLIEKDVVAYQNGIGNTAVHKSIFRKAISTNLMGDLVTSGTTAAGAEFNNTFTYDVSSFSYNKAKLQLFVILWEKVGTTYYYESAYSDFQTLVTTSINTIELADLDINTYSNNGQLFYRLDNISDLADATVELIAMNGQVIQTIYNGQVNHQLQVNVSVADLPKGTYLVRTILDGKMKTLKVLL